MAMKPRLTSAQNTPRLSALRNKRVAGCMLPPTDFFFFRRKDSVSTDAQEGASDARDLENDPEIACGETAARCFQFSCADVLYSSARSANRARNQLRQS